MNMQDWWEHQNGKRFQWKGMKYRIRVESRLVKYPRREIRYDVLAVPQGNHDWVTDITQSEDLEAYLIKKLWNENGEIEQKILNHER